MLAQIFLFLFGGFEILNGNLTIGLFIVLSSYFMKLVGSTKYFISLGNQYIDNIVSANRILSIKSIDNEINGDLLFSDINKIEIKDLAFSFNKEIILDGFNYKFEKGKVYKISGSNGHGKSTLINLIIGLYPGLYEGTIKYDDKPLKEIDMYSLRETNISYIGQDVLLFNSTLKDNVFLDKEYYSNDLFVQYLKQFKFDLHGSIPMEEILNMELNENNTNLSGGELKKLTIIRGLLKPCSVLILDEPTNSLDQASKIELCRILKMKKSDLITILVSHEDCFDEIVDYNICF